VKSTPMKARLKSTPSRLKGSGVREIVMALVLTMRTGESIYVNNDQFTLTRIESKDKVMMLRARDQILFEVTVFEGVEIDEDVVVQLGDRITTKAARISIAAPRSKTILTEDKYQASKKG
jgi:sRNA-binding carbon storage regulator CsrA